VTDPGQGGQVPCAKVVTTKNRQAADKSAEGKPKETAVEFLSSLATVFVIGLFIVTFVAQAFEIPSSSMENTLLIGDHVFVNRIQLAPKTSWVGPLLPYRDPRFEDIVVFLSPAQPGLYLVKRIIGIPGDRIHLCNGVVYRNGIGLNEPYVDHDQDNSADLYRNDFPAVPPTEDAGVYPVWRATMASYLRGDDLVVPPGHYFAMGDHRGVSLDSRYWGFVPRGNIVGRPLLIYWSFETPADQYLKAGFLDRVSFILGHEILHFFDQTRWKRTFQIVK
jgi:signal peptidase I